MTRTTIFRSKGLQAIRLSEAVAFPPMVQSVTIAKQGRSRVVTPSNAAWDDFFDRPGVNLGERDQPSPQTRDGSKRR